MCIKCLAEVTILIKVRHYFSSNHHHNKKHALLWLTFFFQSVSWSSWLGFLLPTPVLLPGKSHGQRSLVGYSPWGRWELDMTHDFTFTFHFHALEKKMATHSSVLAWRIPGTAEPGGLPSVGSHRGGHDWSNLAKFLFIIKKVFYINLFILIGGQLQYCIGFLQLISV